MTFVAPVDTGIWEMSCNMSGSQHHGHGWPTACAGWNGVWDASTAAKFKSVPLGTMDHHLHLYLQVNHNLLILKPTTRHIV